MAQWTLKTPGGVEVKYTLRQTVEGYDHPVGLLTLEHKGSQFRLALSEGVLDFLSTVLAIEANKELDIGPEDYDPLEEAILAEDPLAELQEPDDDWDQVDREEC